MNPVSHVGGDTPVDCHQVCPALNKPPSPSPQGEPSGKDRLWLPCWVSVLQKVFPSQWNQPKEMDIGYRLGLPFVISNALLQSMALS